MHDIGRRRAWVIWLVGLAVYVVAVFHRTSLGVAGLVAAERFDITAAQLATFTVLQLVVYAGMQIPVGVLLDRFGSRLLLLVGLALMTAGQLWFAFAGSFEVGLAARVLLGIGDAMIFTSLLRLVALWFRVKQAPVVTQLSGMIGQLGAVAAATPLAAALERFGWERSFGIAAGAGALLSVALVLLVKDSPYTGVAIEKIKVRALARTLAEVWGNPGTRLAMWIHFTGQFGATVFTMLWGYPFLVEGQGLSPGLAGGLLITLTLSAVVAGPVVGSLTGRLPYRRSQIVQVIVVAMAIVWALVLLWPGRAPLWLLVLLVCVTGVRRPRLDGRLRPRPHLPPVGAAGPGGRGHQHRRVHGVARDDGAHRRHPRPAGAGRAGHLHAHRLQVGDVGAVPALGLRLAPDLALPPQGTRRSSTTTRGPSTPCAPVTPCCPASRATPTDRPRDRRRRSCPRRVSLTGRTRVVDL